MRQRFTVTIADYRGARHYSLHHIAKGVALGTAAMILLILLLGGGAIYLLSQEIQQLDTVRAEKAQAVREYEQRNEELRELVSERERELQRMDLELGHIESLVGLDPEPEAHRHERLDTAGQTALEKGLMLRTIPSGWPLEEPSRITSGYGYRDHPVTGQRSFHAAVDLRADIGDPVLATADGVVNFAGPHDDSGMGNLIIIDHDFGFRTHYAHLDSLDVERGEFVEEGEVIGRSGATGNVSGPHLHYEIWHLQRQLNPEPFLEWNLERYDHVFEEESRVQWDSLAQGISQRAEALERQLSAMGQESSGN